MATFIDHPQTVPCRRAIFTVHLWMGIATGLYMFIVCVTGALLVFRIDMQRAIHPDLLLPRTDAPLASAALVIDSLQRAYPDARISGVDAPTQVRPVYLAYVANGSGFHTVLIDPGTAQVLGELPERSSVRTLQNLHFNLLMGKSGKLINGIGALCLVVLCLTGAVIWWQGRRRWHRGLKVRWRSGPAQFNWDLHGATGFWTLLLIVMWALTALNFTFPQQFRAVIRTFSSITPPPVGPTGNRAVPADQAPLTWSELLARAGSSRPGEHVARVVVPGKAGDPLQVMFSDHQPTPTGPSRLATVYVDTASGEILPAPVAAAPTMGDTILKWAAPLHVGNFGGTGIRILWLLLGLAPPLLFVTGMISWWRRVVRPAYLRARRARAGTEGGTADAHAAIE